MPSMVDLAFLQQRSAAWLTALLCAAAVSSTILGCAAPEEQTRWESDILAAQRLHDRGDLSTAEQRYEELLERADDAEDRRYVRLQMARLAADRGETERALEVYRAVWSEPLDDSHGARALHEASRLVDERQDNPERARAMRRKLIRRYPESAWAERSVESLAEYYADREAWEALQSEFDQLYADVQTTPLAGPLLQTVGETLWRRAGRPDAALPYFLRVIEDHADGLVVDDAEWAAGRIFLRRQQWERAVPILRQLAKRVDASWLVGTLNSPHASKARYQLGFIHMTFLDDYAEAIDHFERYLADFPRNRRADDSAWHLGQAHRLAGDRGGYRRALKRLIEEFPESRFVEPARQELRLMQ